MQGDRYDAFLLGDALAARLTKGDDSALAGYSSACLRRVWDHQEFSQWPSEPFHGTAAGDPLRAGTTLARLRRLCASPRRRRLRGAVPGHGRAVLSPRQSCGGRLPSRWSATFSASSTSRRRWPSRSE
ncbi:hypothetical protein GCM10010398_11190 [Streptomyces fimbriatus]